MRVLLGVTGTAMPLCSFPAPSPCRRWRETRQARRCACRAALLLCPEQVPPFLAQVFFSNILALLLQRHARHAPLSASSCLASAAESPFAAPHQVQPDDEPKRKAHRNQPQEARMVPLMSPAMSKLSMCVRHSHLILSDSRARVFVGRDLGLHLLV